MRIQISLVSLGVVLATGLYQPANAGAIASAYAYVDSSEGFFEQFAQSPEGATSAHALGTSIDNSQHDGSASAGEGTLSCGSPSQPVCFDVGTQNGQSRALAEANGAKGTLRAFASAAAEPQTGAKFATGSAGLRDTITFNGAPVINIDLDFSAFVNGERANLGLGFTLGYFGTVCGGESGNDCQTEVINLMEISLRAVEDFQFGDDLGYVVRRYDADGNLIVETGDDLPGSFDLSLDLGFLGGTTFDIFADLNAFASAEDGSALIAADQTAYLGIKDYQSTSGYNYAGRQGTTPDPDPVPVPAPPSLALLMAGLAGLGWVRRRRTA